MRKRILTYCIFDFLLGMLLVMLFPALFNLEPDGSAQLCSTQLIARHGGMKATLLFSFLVYGLYGAGCIGGMLLYRIEEWSLTRATLVHYLFAALGYVLSNYLLCWGLSGKELLVIEGLMTFGFFLVWMIIYQYYKAQVRELNRLSKEHARHMAEDGNSDQQKK